MAILLAAMLGLPAAAAHAQTASIPLSTIGTGPQSGTLPNSVAWTVNTGQWVSPQGYVAYPPASPQVYGFSQPVWLRYGLAGLNVSGECFGLPPGSVPESINPRHAWTPSAAGGGTLCGAGARAGDESVFTSGPVTSLSLDILNVSSAGRGLTFLDVSISQPQPPLNTCSVADTRATERFWFFGTNGAIDFGTSGTTATAFLGTQSATEGSTVVTDTSGQLLFWSNGLTVFDRNSVPMPNGSGLIGNQSATQTVAAFPSLTRTGVYFVVSTSGAAEVGGTGDLHYSVVDMTLNSGLGDVTDKNVLLGPSGTASEALTAVPNADGTGFWVLTFTGGTANVLAYAFDGDGPVTGTPVISVMSTSNGNQFATFNFSADLTQLVQQTGSTAGAQVRLLAFDAANGSIRERITWNLPAGAGTGTSGYSADFSPSGEYVYATKIFGGAHLYRYRIAGASTAADVEATMEDLGQMIEGGQVRRAPDGRMYVANRGQTSISVVNIPDDPTNPDFQPLSFALPAGAASIWGLPQTVTGCPVPLPPDLQIVKSTSDVGVAPGDNFTYTLEVMNNGALTAHNLVTTDTLPDQVIFVSADAGCVVSGQTVTCTAPELAGGASQTWHIVVQLDPAYTGDGSDILNSAHVDMDEEDPLPNNNTTPGGAPPVGPALADLAIVKDVSADDVRPGSQFNYSILVSNQGPSAATDVVVTDTLPAGVTFVSSPEACTAVGQAVTCPTIATLNPGASETYTLVVALDAAYRGDGSDLPNTASVDSTTDDPVPGNNVNPPVTPHVVDPLTDIAVSVAASKMATVPGDVVTVTVSARNLGPMDATGVVVSVPAAAGLSLVDPPAGYDAGTGSWAVGALPNGGQASLALPFRVTTAGVPGVRATRTAIDQVDSNAANDTSVASLTARNWSTFESDLVVTALASPTVVEPGQVLTYAVSGTNRGPTYVIDMAIEGTVPAGTTFEGVTTSPGGICAPAAGVVRCTWPGATLLDSVGSRSMQLQVRVSPSAAPGSSVTAAFSVGSDDLDYYDASNHAVVTTAVSDGTRADLELSALMLSEGVLGTELPLPLGVATPLRFTVTNHGAAATRSALYTVSVPESDIDGIQIVSATVSQGGADLAGPSSANWQIGELAPGTSATFDMTIIMHSMASTSLVMRRVDSQPGDPNSANDVATLVLDGTGDPTGGDRFTAVGNLDGAGPLEIVTGAGRLETPQVRVFSGTGEDTGVRFYAYNRNFKGGVRVATCDTDGDGIDEIVTAPGIGPGPHVRVMRVTAESIDEVIGFYAFDADFVGGVSVACADVDNDGRAEVVAGMENGGSEVRVFDVDTGSVVQAASFMPYEEGFQGGVRVAALDQTSTSGAQYQVLTVPGPGRPLEVRAWTLAGATASLARSVPVTGPEYQLGGFIDIGDVDHDGQLDAVLATDKGIGTLVGAVTIDSGQFIGSFAPFGPSFLGGARISLGDIDGDGQTELLVSSGPGGRPYVDVLTTKNALTYLFRLSAIELP